MRKLNFHLVPVKGAVKSNGGKFRAEFVRGRDVGDNFGVIGFDDVVAEAIEEHKLQGVSSIEFSVVKFNEEFDVDEKAMDKYRNIRASILPG